MLHKELTGKLRCGILNLQKTQTNPFSHRNPFLAKQIILGTKEFGCLQYHEFLQLNTDVTGESYFDEAGLNCCRSSLVSAGVV